MDKGVSVIVSQEKWDIKNKLIDSLNSQLNALMEAGKNSFVILDRVKTSRGNFPCVVSFPDSKDFKDYIGEATLITESDVITSETAFYWKERHKEDTARLCRDNSCKDYRIDKYNSLPFWKKIITFKV